MSRIVLISDTHDRHAKLPVPDGDILIHAGDLTMCGRYEDIKAAGEWLRSQPHKLKIAIAGNHDWLFETDRPKALEALGSGIHYLENTGIVLDSLMIWGSPVQPWFMDWAFNVQRGPAIRKIWDKIPYGLDILVTHGPPRGILDQSAPHHYSEHLGCDDLMTAVCEKRPRVHAFGHIHGGYGRYAEPHSATTFFNAAVLNEAYQLQNSPWVIDLEPK